ncbi:MAG: hypothetical protein H0T05_04730 [Acidobacteria bacterium]|jgi:hypothetical protein|nr:hypothetical protein [Acidobacteriota bacterium]
MIMLGPREVAFIEQECGVSYAAAKRAAGEGNPAPFWSFVVSDEPPTEEDLRVAHKLIEQSLAEDGPS